MKCHKLLEVPKFRVSVFLDTSGHFPLLDSLVSFLIYNARCQTQPKWHIRFTDFVSQPRSQGPLLLRPRVGEDPGNEVQGPVCQSGRPVLGKETYSWCNKNKLKKLTTSVLHVSVLLLIMNFVISLIIHEEKTKEITTVKEVWKCNLTYHKIL